MSELFGVWWPNVVFLAIAGLLFVIAVVEWWREPKNNSFGSRYDLNKLIAAGATLFGALILEILQLSDVQKRLLNVQFQYQLSPPDNTLLSSTVTATRFAILAFTFISIALLGLSRGAYGFSLHQSSPNESKPVGRTVTNFSEDNEHAPAEKPTGTSGLR